MGLGHAEHLAWRCAQYLIAAAGGADRRSARRRGRVGDINRAKRIIRRGRTTPPGGPVGRGIVAGNIYQRGVNIAGRDIVIGSDS
jgi:hypothetical protein